MSVRKCSTCQYLLEIKPWESGKTREYYCGRMENNDDFKKLRQLSRNDRSLLEHMACGLYVPSDAAEEGDGE